MHGINATVVLREGYKIEAARQRDGQRDSRNQPSKLLFRGYREKEMKKLGDQAENKSSLNFKPVRIKLSSLWKLWKKVREEKYP